MRSPGQKRQLVLGVNVPIRIVLQQRVIVVLVLVPVLRGATRRMMASIRRRIGWGHNATSCEVVRVTEGVIIVVVRHEMREGVRIIPVDRSRLAWMPDLKKQISFSNSIGADFFSSG